MNIGKINGKFTFCQWRVVSCFPTDQLFIIKIHTEKVFRQFQMSNERSDWTAWHPVINNLHSSAVNRIFVIVCAFGFCKFVSMNSPSLPTTCRQFYCFYAALSIESLSVVAYLYFFPRVNLLWNRVSTVVFYIFSVK